MKKDKNMLNKKDDDLEKGDFFTANAFVVVLFVGILISVLVFTTMS